MKCLKKRELPVLIAVQTSSSISLVIAIATVIAILATARTNNLNFNRRVFTLRFLIAFLSKKVYHIGNEIFGVNL